MNGRIIPAVIIADHPLYIFTVIGFFAAFFPLLWIVRKFDGPVSRFVAKLFRVKEQTAAKIIMFAMCAVSLFFAYIITRIAVESIPWLGNHGK